MPYFLEVESKYILLFVLCKVLAKKKNNYLNQKMYFLVSRSSFDI